MELGLKFLQIVQTIESNFVKNSSRAIFNGNIPPGRENYEISDEHFALLEETEEIFEIFKEKSVLKMEVFLNF